MAERWEEELEELLRSKWPEPIEDFLEVAELVGSETMDYDPDEAVIDYLTSAAQKKVKEAAREFSFTLGENLLEILRVRCMTILPEVTRRTRLCVIMFQYGERKLKFIRVW